jgi:NAD(P)-dependent dehydrogenase (short-subunit alcohol dehydrogenase family)
MDISVAGRRVLITAAGSGIGRVVARTLMAEGAQVHISDMTDDALADARAELPDLGTTVADAADAGAAERMVADAVGRMGGLDCLINNVGTKGPTGPVEAIDPDAWAASTDTNLDGHFYAARAAVRHLKDAGGGAIITMSSAAGRLGYPNRTPYAAVKWALIGFTQSLAMELGPANIRANAILPGNVRGDRMERVLAAEAEAEGITIEAAGQRAVAASSMNAWIEPEEIAALIVFLMSDAGRHISGQSIGICGNIETLANG